MSLYEKSPEYYLELVKDWEDPNPKPVIELHDGIHVVRDDLLDAGSKVRFIDYFVIFCQISARECQGSCLWWMPCDWLCTNQSPNSLQEVWKKSSSIYG